MASQPLPNYYRKAFQDFSDGLNTFDDPLKLPATQLVQSDNTLVNELGLLEKAPGYILDSAPFSSSDSTSLIRMLHNYKRGSTVDLLIASASDATNANATYKVDTKYSAGDGSWDYIGYAPTASTCTFTNGSANVTAGVNTAFTSNLKAGDKIKPNGTSVWYEISVVSGATTLTLISNFAEATQAVSAFKARIILHKDYLPRALTFNNNLIITNGSETMSTFDNTSQTLIQDTDAPKAKYIVAHKSRIFAAGTASYPSSIFWSSVNDETNWAAESTEPVFAYDNGVIVNIISFANSLLVFKDSGKVYQVVGEFDQSAAGDVSYIRKLDTPDNMGLIAGLTVTIGNNNKCYFLTETGIYSIDPSMRVSLESWDIKNLFTDLQLKSTLTSSKVYTYNTQTQWDLGTKSGTRSTSGGDIESIFDNYTVSDAYKNGRCLAVKIDSTNVLHLAYVYDLNRAIIKYSKWALDGTLTTETAYTSTLGDVWALSMDVASNGNVGIALQHTSAAGGVYFTERTSGSGAWSAIGTSVVSARAFSTKYTTGNVPKFAVIQDFNLSIQLMYGGLTGSNVNPSQVATNIGNQTISGFKLFLNATDQPTVSFYDVTGLSITAYNSTDSGASFSSLASFAVTTVPGTANTSLGLNGISDKLLVYGDNGSIKKRNITTSTTTTLSSATDRIPWYSISSDRQAWLQISSAGTETFNYETSYTTGTAVFTNGNTAVVGTNTLWLANVSVGDVIKSSAHADSVYGTVLTVNSNTSITLSAVYGGATVLTTTYIAKHSQSVANPSTATSELTIASGGDSESNTTAPVYGFAQFGANASEIIVRRIGPKATWVSNERSDATLSAWGTYDVTGQISNGNTVTHEVALNTVSPASVYATIVSGSTINTDATKIYVIARITVLLTAWSKSVVGAIDLNYTGTGIDGKIPAAVTFDNQLYFSVCGAGQTENDKCLMFDRNDKWVGPHTYPVTVFARYKTQLYAGSAANGKVFKLLNGFSAAGSATTMTAITKEDLLGSLELKKDVYTAYVLYKIQNTGTFTFSYRLDNFMYPAGATWIDTTVSQISGGASPGVAEILIGNKCRSIQFKVSNSTLDNQVGIVGVVLLYGYLNLR